MSGAILYNMNLQKNETKQTQKVRQSKNIDIRNLKLTNTIKTWNKIVNDSKTIEETFVKRRRLVERRARIQPTTGDEMYI